MLPASARPFSGARSAGPLRHILSGGCDETDHHAARLRDAAANWLLGLLPMRIASSATAFFRRRSLSMILASPTSCHFPTIAGFKNGDDPAAQELDISGEYSKTITENFGCRSRRNGYTSTFPAEGTKVRIRQSGTSFKYQFVRDPDGRAGHVRIAGRRLGRDRKSEVGAEIHLRRSLRPYSWARGLASFRRR